MAVNLPHSSVPITGSLAVAREWYQFFTKLGRGGSGSGLDADTVDGFHASSFREKLTAARTYYVSTTGSDSDDGLTVSTPFLTIQKAVNVILGTLDRSTFAVTIQVADGTYTGVTTINGSGVGSGGITIQGNAAAPLNVQIQTAGSSFQLNAKAIVTIKDMTVASSGGWGFTVQDGSILYFSNIVFGACPAAGHLYANTGSVISCQGNYSIGGDALYHWYGENNANYRVTGRTITLLVSPRNFSVFAVCATGCMMTVFTNTFTGTATGQRYLVFLNGAISVNGAGATYLPGSTAGGTATGGQYA